MTSDRKLVPALSALLLFASGCGEEDVADPGTHARGSIEAFGYPDETALLAHYSSELDDESCEARDAVSECVLLRCEDEVRAFEGAGVVTVGGEALEIADDNSYALVVLEAPVPGETLEMRASGSSAVPKHGGDVVVPERAELTSELADIPVIDTSQDFVVTWNPVESDRVILRMTFLAFQIECATTGSFGQITVASSLLLQLPQEASGPFSITNENLVEKSVSGWRLWFRAHQVVVDGTIELAPRQ